MPRVAADTVDELVRTAGSEPDSLGPAYERILDRAERRRLGAFYTPAPLAAELAAATLGPLVDAGADPDAIRVFDPAVGGGALLLAAARYLCGRGGRAAAVVANMAGLDIDPNAARLADASLRLLGGRPHITVGDALDTVTGRSFDAVITNPPFHGQLRRRTVRSRAEAATLRARFGEAAAGYADTAHLFLVLSLDAVRPGGRVGIVLPEPVVVTRDGAAARRLVGSNSRLDRLWPAPEAGFDAGVRIRLATFERADAAGAPGAWREGRWAAAAQGADDPPPVDPRADGVVGDMASTSAGFRDEFYGVAPVVEEGAVSGHPLVTCGLIDPALLRWGDRPARVAGRRFQRPVVPERCVDDGTAGRRWIAPLLRPKVLLATQTRLLEAVADDTGTVVPAVPVISVVPEPDRVWALLAVLLAPPVAGFARREYAGAGLSADAIKLSARQVATLPLPAGRAAWDAGATLARAATMAGRAGDLDGWRGALDRLGQVMCRAYGVPPDPLLAWWSARLDLVQQRISR